MISVVCYTYGRFTQIKRLLSFFVNQDYQDKELIIFNTAPVYFDDPKIQGVKIINQEMVNDRQKFSNMTQICIESFKHVNGDLYSVWADDDYYMPYHLSQCIERKKALQVAAYKPKISLFSNDGGNSFQDAENNMESSIIVDTKNVFFEETLTGEEHIPWLTKLRDDKAIKEDDYAIQPSYAFVWGDGLHKNSGNIQNPANFENHKSASKDFGSKLELVDLKNIYQSFYNHTKDKRLLEYL